VVANDGVAKKEGSAWKTVNDAALAAATSS